MTEHTGGNTRHSQSVGTGQVFVPLGPCPPAQGSTQWPWAQPAQLLLCSWQAPAAAAVPLLR